MRERHANILAALRERYVSVLAALRGRFDGATWALQYRNARERTVAYRWLPKYRVLPNINTQAYFLFKLSI